MDTRSLFDSLMTATSTGEVEAALAALQEDTDNRADWVPFGGRANNRGPIEVSADPGRSLVERITNGIDAILEVEHLRHNGVPDCRTPKEAAAAWLGVPPQGLSALTQRQRQLLADRLSVTIKRDNEDRLVEIRDRGVGLGPDEMVDTILSLNESNKIQKHYLVGTYGQGGSSTLAISSYVLIASRRADNDFAGFTVVRFLDLPPDTYKTGHYVYLTVEGRIPAVELAMDEFPPGTLVRHFGYDLSPYPSPLGPNSVYGLLQQVLFDPVMPVWLETEVHRYRRVIKGSRNALNGAVDEGDDARGPTLSHNVPMFYVSLGEFGTVGVEYWALERPSQANRRPSASYVNPNRPIILTIHGQNHGELPQSVIRKDAELPYLAPRLICHLDCNPLTAGAKRALFSSNREDARHGLLYNLIHDELVRILRSDDDLLRLNEEAGQERLRERDENAVQEMRRSVAQILRLHGLSIGEAEGTRLGPAETREGSATRTRGARRRPTPITANEPPTYVRLVWEEGHPIDFHAGQRRYVRIETDASSAYHDPANPGNSRVNLIVGDGPAILRGTTPLAGGRMRVILDANENATRGQTSSIRVELSRPGLPSLADQRDILIVDPPPQRPGPERLTLPLFEVHAVAPEDDLWADLDWPDDVNVIASSMQLENGTLMIYYSRVFPRYRGQFSRYEQRDPALAASFRTRYEVWLAAHSLLIHRDQQQAEQPAQASTEQEDQVIQSKEQAERCRVASIAALFATREVELVRQAPGDQDS